MALPPATRGLTFALLGFTTILALMRFTLTEEKLKAQSFSKQDSALEFPWLVIVPGQSWMYPWTLLTSGFCETSFIEAVLSLILIPLLGRYLEQIWGAVELLKFSAVVIIGSNIIAWALAILQFAVLRNVYVIYGTQYHGLTGLQTGFLVGLTQMIPEHQVQIFNGRLNFHVKNLPMGYVTFSTVLCMLGFISPWILIQFGWLIGWVWLRFFRLSESGFRGDHSETFSFVSWFPPFVHRPVTILSNFLHRIFIRLHVIQPWQYSDLETGPNASHIPSGPSRAEAERRRAMALKALDQRVAGNPGGGRGAKGPGLSRQGSTHASGAASSSAARADSRTNGDAGADVAHAAADDKDIDDTQEADGLLKLDQDEGDLGATR
ncbi:DUF1751-domain-containing protein [Tilletiaria anomala UBC 951]|uniref:DUF1751-domain-containing protein n=1 Tax=Tilletiaria anomala (strain ATCC 24038 / CBS 436.72 / UBC 951) TaxID=1037660 RepID=A0A066WAM1_TILAU|nr:DUF1751-domain-containing protein [Tilletiaria anomala UBC 951]KDN49603.1 DUF1751-domain-containing protein [Tilletiaria anomala UBC 951]